MSKPNEVPVTEPGASGGGGLRSIVVIAGGTFGIQAMLLVTGIISARLLGVEGRGQIALVSAAPCSWRASPWRARCPSPCHSCSPARG